MAPGSDSPIQSAADVRRFVEQHGLPVAIKAAFGGGGRGLKVVREADSIEESFASAVRESKAAFGREECFVEKFLDRPRHVEAQILADRQGNVVVVGTRDCSLQRRNQKLVEEAPAPFLTTEQRERIHRSAKAICREAGYEGAGNSGVPGGGGWNRVLPGGQYPAPGGAPDHGGDLRHRPCGRPTGHR